MHAGGNWGSRWDPPSNSGWQDKLIAWSNSSSRGPAQIWRHWRRARPRKFPFQSNNQKAGHRLPFFCCHTVEKGAEGEMQNMGSRPQVRVLCNSRMQRVVVTSLPELAFWLLPYMLFAVWLQLQGDYSILGVVGLKGLSIGKRRAAALDWRSNHQAARSENRQTMKDWSPKIKKGAALWSPRHCKLMHINN